MAHQSPVVWLQLLAAVALACAPLFWVLHHRGARRKPDAEGRTDGFLLLFALLSGVFALFLAVTSVARMPREPRDVADSDPVRVEVQSCGVERRRPAGRTGGTSYELTCTVRHRTREGAHEHDVRAGFPGRRRSLDEWMRRHPSGSTITLRQARAVPERLSGFAEQIPSSTTSARGAARESLLFGAIAGLLFALSRVVVVRRGTAVRGAGEALAAL